MTEYYVRQFLFLFCSNIYHSTINFGFDLHARPCPYTFSMRRIQAECNDKYKFLTAQTLIHTALHGTRAYPDAWSDIGDHTYRISRVSLAATIKMEYSISHLFIEQKIIRTSSPFITSTMVWLFDTLQNMQNCVQHAEQQVKLHKRLKNAYCGLAIDDWI